MDPEPARSPIARSATSIRSTSFHNPTGSAAADQLAFFHLLEKLKTQKRTGWLNNNIRNPESISDHMYRVSVLALASSDATLDISRCALMAVIHDLAEAHVGDIAPSHGITKAEKQSLEKKAIDNIVQEMLHGSAAARRIEGLWEEYEAGETPEAKFVKDLDLFEMALQAMEYEKDPSNGGKNLQSFFDSSIPRILHPEVKEWARELGVERQVFWGAEGGHGAK